MNDFSAFKALTDDELRTINGGDGFWSRVAQGVGYVVGSLVGSVEKEFEIYAKDPELYMAIHGK